MFAPLSGKQQREWLKFSAKESRESAKMENDEKRKERLHEIKLQEAAAKANQGIGHKEELHGLKIDELSGPLGKKPRMNRQKLGLPSSNPMSGTGMFKQGQHMLAQGTDTVPAMLTPGEAVIPRAAAQDPRNKPMIAKMVQQGRKAQKLSTGTSDVTNMPTALAMGYENGTIDAQDEQMYNPDKYAEGSINVVQRDGIPMMHGGYVPHYQSGVEGVGFQDDPNFYNNDTYQYTPPEVPVVQQTAPQPVVAEQPKPVNLSEVTPPPPQPRQQINFENLNKPELPAFDAGSGEGWDNTAPAAPVASAPAVVPPVTNAPVKLTTDPTKSPTDFLLEAQRKTESGNRHYKNGKLIESNKGALGISQVMPKTGIDPGLGVKPLQNQSEEEYIRFQKDYMGALLKRYGNDEEKALAAYNWGMGNVDKAITKDGDKWKTTLPSETRAYIGKTLDSRNAMMEPNIPRTGNVAVAALDKLPASIRQRYERDLESTNPKIRATAQEALMTYRNEPTGRFQNVLPSFDAGSGEGWDNVSSKPLDPVEQKRLAGIYDTWKKGGEVDRNELPQDIKDKDKKLSDVTQSQIGELGTWDRIAPKNASPEQTKSFWTKAFETVFGDTGIFNGRELTRFALLAASSKLLGYSDVQAVRFAGRSTLEASDERFKQETIDKREVLKAKQAAIVKYGDQRLANYNTSIKDAEAKGALTYQSANKARRFLERGNYGAIEEMLNNPQYGTTHFQAGLEPNAPVVNVSKPGHTTTQTGYKNKTGDIVLFDTTPDGKTTVRIADKGMNVRSSADDIAHQKEALESVQKGLAKHYFEDNRVTKDRRKFDMDQSEVMSQINSWSKEQRRLGLPDDPSMHTEALNHMLDYAAKTGEKKPNIGKLMSMAAINSATLTDTNKITGKDGKNIPTSKMGEISDNIRTEFKNNEKLTSEFKNPTGLIDAAAIGFEKQRGKFTPESLAEKVDRKNPYYNKIKEAPNDWWAYVYYTMAVNKQGK